MKLGLHIVDYTWPDGPAQNAATLVELTRTAEAVGFDAIAVADHVWQNRWIGGPEREMLEAYAKLELSEAPLPERTCFLLQGGYLSLSLRRDAPRQTSFEAANGLLEKAAARRK